MENQKCSQDGQVPVRWDLVVVRTREDGGVVCPLIAGKYPDVELDVLIDAARSQSLALRNLNLHRALGSSAESAPAPYHECRVYVAHDGVLFPVHHLMTPGQAVACYAREKKSAHLRAELDRRQDRNLGLRVVAGGRRPFPASSSPRNGGLRVLASPEPPQRQALR